MHRAPDRGSVAALVPRRQLEVAALLGDAGIVGRAGIVHTARARSPTRSGGGRRSRTRRRARRATARVDRGGRGDRRRDAPRPRAAAARHRRPRPPPRTRAARPRCAGPGRRGRSRVGAVHRHDEVIGRAGARDVEEAQLLVEAHLLVDRLVELERIGLRVLGELHLVAAVGREEHLHAALDGVGAGGGARADDDRELEPLGTVDRHDPHRVVVGLGEHGLDHPRAFRALERRPREVVAQRAPPAASPNARAWSTTNRTRRATSRNRPESTPTSNTCRSRTMRSSSSLGVTQVRSSVQRAEVADRFGPTGWSSGERLGRSRTDVEPAAVLGVELEQVVVAAAEHRRAQRAHERELVARVVDRAQRHQQVADLARAVDERARLRAVRDAGIVERALEEVERRARRATGCTRRRGGRRATRRSPLAVDLPASSIAARTAAATLAASRSRIRIGRRARPRADRHRGASTPGPFGAGRTRALEREVLGLGTRLAAGSGRRTRG